MIRPRHFTPNPETATDNRFQSAPDSPADETARRAFDEVGRAADTLREASVTVHLFDDDGRHQTPDPVFPNNWFSTHPGGHVALDAIVHPQRAAEVRQRLEETGREVLPITQQQVADFAGNAIELSTPQGRELALSARAERSLSEHQRRVIEGSARLLPLDVPTIELAGGSVRCMLAGVHLAPRRNA